MYSKGVVIFLVIVLAISLGLNFYFSLAFIKPDKPTVNLIELRKKYPYLSQKVLTEYNRDILINFLTLRTDLHKVVDPYDSTFGLYFEYLPTGATIGINDEAEFYAASLIKVPVVMAYYHQKRRLGLSDQEVTIESTDLNDKFGTLWKKGAGQKIKMSELVRLTLEESDNTAGDAILHRIDNQDFLRVYEGLDIPLKVENDEAIITAQQYASVLKSLFYTSILPKEDSQEILEYLVHTKFTNKLPAGVDKGIPIAHKVGILGGELYQDCGIVYLPKRPYLLCMISNSDENEANARMQKVSRIVYDYVSGKMPNTPSIP